MTDRTDREVMQMALWAIEDSGHKADLMAAADALRAALAEPVQEPIPLNDGRLWQYPDGSIGIGKLAEPVQEPVAWQWLDSAHFRKKIPDTATPSEWRPLYTTPPSRLPLTDEEIDALWRKQVYGFNSATTSMLVRGFARAIERKITGGNDE